MTDQAVVLGSGIAGLLAAAVLAEEYSSIAIVERDHLPNTAIQRRGAPQGRHLHSLLSRGSHTFDELVPGVLADLAAAGAVVLDDANLGRIHLQTGRYTFNRTDAVADPAALVTYLASRPFVEFHLRRRVAALPNVTILDGRDVGELIAAQPDRITGVTTIDRLTGISESLTADLVVDATGRSARAPFLLQHLGYESPPQRAFDANGVYYSQQLAIPEQHSFPEKLVLVLPEDGARRGGLAACEDDTWTLTVAARTTDVDQPTNFGDMLALAARFVPRHIQSALHTAQPLTDVATYRYPGGVWRRYEHMSRYPKGLLAVGDALCCLDPINGQGMTMAALHAHALREHLRTADPADPQAFFTSVATVIAPVWAANRGVNPTKRSSNLLQQRVIRWTRRKMLQAAPHDIVVTERLSRVANLVDPPQRLLEPTLLAHVLAHHASVARCRRTIKRVTGLRAFDLKLRRRKQSEGPVGFPPISPMKEDGHHA